MSSLNLAIFSGLAASFAASRFLSASCMAAYAFSFAAAASSVCRAPELPLAVLVCETAAPVGVLVSAAIAVTGGRFPRQVPRKGRCPQLLVLLFLRECRSSRHLISRVGDSAGSTTVSIPIDWRAADRACAPLRFSGNRIPLEMTSCLRFFWAHRTIMIRIECE